VPKYMKITIILFAMAVVALLGFVFGKNSGGVSASKLFSKGRDTISADVDPESGAVGIADRQKALEDRMARLQAQMAVVGANANAAANQTDETDTAEDENAGDPMQVDPETRRMELLNVIEQNTANFENQGYDAKWSEKATSSLRTMLSGVTSKLGARLENVECKTTDCMATVEFESFETVRDGVDYIAMHRYPVNCSLRLSTPEPENANEPYQMKVFFQNCTRDEENM
jgi:hypothetical protein